MGKPNITPQKCTNILEKPFVNRELSWNALLHQFVKCIYGKRIGVDAVFHDILADLHFLNSTVKHGKAILDIVYSFKHFSFKKLAFEVFLME